MDLGQRAIDLHKKYHGKIGTNILMPVENRDDLSLVYTPGVGAVSKEIFEHPEKIWDLTSKNRMVAVVSDGSAVLGLGNIGAEAAIPVMEGKALLFKKFANLDAFPICLATQNVDEIVETVKRIAPVFGGINLEDISAPRCFEVEERLQDLGIPVMHDDQHGTAVVVLAALMNVSRLTGKKIADMKIVINGAGAAGQAIMRVISRIVDSRIDNCGDILMLDSKGIISKNRNDLDKYKKEIAEATNKNNIDGDLNVAISGADVFIGVSKPGIFLPEYVKLMNPKAAIFAMANPIPEIMPDEAKKAGIYVMATGRSDFPNQINNSLAFPGIFLGAMRSRAKNITMEMKLAASKAISEMVDKPSVDKIIPGPFDKGLVERVATAVSSV